MNRRKGLRKLVMLRRVPRRVILTVAMGSESEVWCLCLKRLDLLCDVRGGTVSQGSNMFSLVYMTTLCTSTRTWSSYLSASCFSASCEKLSKSETLSDFTFSHSSMMLFQSSLDQSSLRGEYRGIERSRPTLTILAASTSDT